MAHLPYFGFLVCQIKLLLQKQQWHRVQVYGVYYNTWDAFSLCIKFLLLLSFNHRSHGRRRQMEEHLLETFTL